MANNWQNLDKVTPIIHKNLDNNLILAKSVDRRYDSMYAQSGAQSGDTIRVRYPNAAGAATDGRVAISTEDLSDFSKSITLDYLKSPLALVTGKQLKLEVEDFEAQVLAPLGIQLANGIEMKIANLFSKVPISVGTPGVAPTSIKPFNLAKARLMLEGCTELNNLKAAIHPMVEPEIIAGLSGLFNAQSELTKQFNTGNIGFASGMSFSSTQLMPSHACGSYGGTPLVNDTVVEGDAVISTDGWSSGASALKAGDVISFAGVYAVNPVTHQATTNLKQFVVKADVADTTGAMDIQVSPAFSLIGVDAVSALPVNDAKVFVYGKDNGLAAGTVSNLSLVYHKDAFVLGTAALPEMSGVQCKRWTHPKLNIPFRVMMDTNIYNDAMVIRLDTMVGAIIGRDNWACRIEG